MVNRSHVSPMLLSAVALLMCFLITITSFTILLLLDTIVFWKISESLKLQNGSESLETWKMKGTQSQFSVYFYNLTNPQETLNGGTPILKATGPYVYWQTDEKVNISWTNVEGIPAISYYKRSIYKYDSKLSIGDPRKDKITSTNLPILAVSAADNAGRGPSAATIEMVKLWTSPEIFTTQTVDGFLWGYKDTMLGLCRVFYPETCKSDKVGLLLNNNNTLKGPFVVDAGILNSSNTGKFLSIKNNRHLRIWSTKRANEIRGIDGARLGKDIHPGDTREVYVPLLCRPITLVAEGYTYPRACRHLKVIVMEMDPSYGYPDEAYCPKKPSGPVCPAKGLFDISQCAMEGDIAPPVFASLPHFLNTEDNISAPLLGLRPADLLKDNFKLLAEPKTGIVVEAHIRLQVNAHIQRSAHLGDLFRNVPDPFFLPIAWFESDIVGTSKAIKGLHQAVYEKPDHVRRILAIVVACSGAFFGLILLLLITLLLMNHNNKLPLCVSKHCRKNSSVRHLLMDSSADSASDLLIRTDEDTVRSIVSPWAASEHRDHDNSKEEALTALI